MSSKNLFVLIGILALLAAAAYFTRSRGPAPGTADAPAIGDLVVPGLDVNQTQSIRIVGPDGSNLLARVEGTWVVPSLHQYPADFARIRTQLSGLLDMKIGQLMRADDTTRAETGLDDAATVVTLLSADDTAIATLRVGAPRTAQAPGGAGGFGGMGGYPDGQYVAINDEYIAVVSRSLSGFSIDPADWIQRQLLQVDANEIASIEVKNGEDAYRIQNDTNQVMTLEGLADNETFEATSANPLKRALSYLSCQDIADPDLSVEAMELDQPAIYTATLRDGRSYAVALGASTNNSRYARFTVTGDEEHAHLQQWTYLIPSYSADSMTPARDTLVKPVEEDEPVKETAADTETDAAGEADPEPVPGIAVNADPAVNDAEDPDADETADVAEDADAETVDAEEEKPAT